jgi:CxxC motif-containing protein (DUF1111 family)
LSACGDDAGDPPSAPVGDVDAGADASLDGSAGALPDGSAVSDASVTVDASARGTKTVSDPFDVPVPGLKGAELTAFNLGDSLFETSMREADGLGPLYTRDSCGSCHASALRGPGLVQKMVVVEADGATPAADQSKLAFGHTVHPLLAAGAKTPILPPANDPSVRVSIRIGVPVLGRGYLEAVSDSELERVAAEQAKRDDGIHGRINHVVYASEANSDTRFHTHAKGDLVYGRFGLKARIATLDDFTADALQGDMGITSPLRPSEFANPDGLLDDRKVGVDIGIDSVNARTNYTRSIAIPRRASDQEAGRALFEQIKCAVCHQPTMHTRADYPLAPLADIDAPIYTDLLLHDMGAGLADSLGGEGEAGPRDWRTSPLIGLRFYTTFLHDGRVRTIADAIEAHASEGSEAAGSVQLFHALSESDRRALLDFVLTL